MSVRASDSVVIEPVISTVDVTELVIDLGTRWNALAKHAARKQNSSSIKWEVLGINTRYAGDRFRNVAAEHMALEYG